MDIFDALLHGPHHRSKDKEICVVSLDALLAFPTIATDTTKGAFLRDFNLGILIAKWTIYLGVFSFGMASTTRTRVLAAVCTCDPFDRRAVVALESLNEFKALIVSQHRRPGSCARQRRRSCITPSLNLARDDV